MLNTLCALDYSQKAFTEVCDKDLLTIWLRQWADATGSQLLHFTGVMLSQNKSRAVPDWWNKLPVTELTTIFPPKERANISSCYRKKRKKKEKKSPTAVCERHSACVWAYGRFWLLLPGRPSGQELREREQCLLSQGELTFLRAWFGSLYPSAVAFLSLVNLLRLTDGPAVNTWFLVRAFLLPLRTQKSSRAGKKEEIKQRWVQLEVSVSFGGRERSNAMAA